MLYEVINPSDTVTFRASCPKVALVAITLVGDGRYALGPHPDRGEEAPKDLPGILAFDPHAMDVITAYIGGDMQEFVEAQAAPLVEALRSFSYCSASERRTYDDAIMAITDPEKFKWFRAKHEDRGRTSMNRIVERAWGIADNLSAKYGAATVKN